MKKDYPFKFMPGDMVYATFDRIKVIGVVDTCAISFNPTPKYWVIFEVSKAITIDESSGPGLKRFQGWYPEKLLKKVE